MKTLRIIFALMLCLCCCFIFVGCDDYSVCGTWNIKSMSCIVFDQTFDYSLQDASNLPKTTYGEDATPQEIADSSISSIIDEYITFYTEINRDNTMKFHFASGAVVDFTWQTKDNKLHFSMVEDKNNSGDFEKIDENNMLTKAFMAQHICVVIYVERLNT